MAGLWHTLSVYCQLPVLMTVESWRLGDTPCSPLPLNSHRSPAAHITIITKYVRLFTEIH